MRVGISSRGHAWASLGCTGMLVIGPFLLSGYLLVMMFRLMVLTGVACVRLAALLVTAIQRGSAAAAAAHARRSVR